jgi:hypothetical protein
MFFDRTFSPFIYKIPDSTDSNIIIIKGTKSSTPKTRNVGSRCFGIGSLKLNNDSKFYLFLLLFTLLLLFIPNSLAYCADEATINGSTNVINGSTNVNASPTVVISISDAIKYIGGASIILASGKATSLVLRSIPANQRLNGLGAIGSLTAGTLVASQLISGPNTPRNPTAIEVIARKNAKPFDSIMSVGGPTDSNLTFDKYNFNVKFVKDSFAFSNNKELSTDNPDIFDKFYDFIHAEYNITDFLNSLADFAYIVGDFIYKLIDRLFSMISYPGWAAWPPGGPLDLNFYLNDCPAPGYFENMQISRSMFFGFEKILNDLPSYMDNPYVGLQYYLLFLLVMATSALYWLTFNIIIIKFGDILINKFKNKIILKVISLNKMYSNYMVWFWLFILLYCILSSIYILNHLIESLPLYVNDQVYNCLINSFIVFGSLRNGHKDSTPPVLNPSDSEDNHKDSTPPVLNPSDSENNHKDDGDNGHKDNEYSDSLDLDTFNSYQKLNGDNPINTFDHNVFGSNGFYKKHS